MAKAFLNLSSQQLIDRFLRMEAAALVLEEEMSLRAIEDMDDALLDFLIKKLDTSKYDETV